jgi:glycosyltransferase involved in cell wall biosynthesis
MKVLVVSKALVSEMYRKKLTAMAALGAQVVAVVPPSWREGGGEQHLEPGATDGYELVVSPLRWNGHFHLHYYAQLPEILDRVRPDLLYMDEEPYNLATLFGVRAAARRRIPSLFFTWQNLLWRLPLPARMVERAVYRRVAWAIAGTEEAASVLHARGFGGGISVAPQFGVDAELFAPGPPPQGPFTIGFFNRLIAAKGPMETLAAFVRLPSDTCLRVIGDGPLRAELEREIERRELGGRVNISGRIASTRMPDTIRSVHVVVLPSLMTRRWKEQFGRILVEAMACGVPVVGSDSGEIPRVIGDAGLVTPEGDVEALREALLLLYGDPELRQRLGDAGRRRVLERYTNDRVAQLTLAACEAALGARQ